MVQLLFPLEKTKMTSELEWRRRWKPDLRARPWKTFTIDDSIYLLKSKFFDNSYSILITDQTSVWFEELNEDDIKKRSKVWRIILLTGFLSNSFKTSLAMFVSITHKMCLLIFHGVVCVSTKKRQ